MRYIRFTIKQKIHFSLGGVYKNKFGIYIDIDQASDKLDRKSISRGIRMFYRGPYCQALRKQKLIATLSAKLEYISQLIYTKQGQQTI